MTQILHISVETVDSRITSALINAGFINTDIVKFSKQIPLTDSCFTYYNEALSIINTCVATYNITTPILLQLLCSQAIWN